MPNKRTVALTQQQYQDIIALIRDGNGSTVRPNPRVATALVLEANLGIRISDILNLRLCDIIRDGDRYRLNITEQKTGKRRSFTVPFVIYQYLENFCLHYGIGRREIIFPMTARNIQLILQKACESLDLENISTHSFRKFFATEIYRNNGYDIMLVQHLLQHSSAAITQKYIGIDTKAVEDALKGHVQLL